MLKKSFLLSLAIMAVSILAAADLEIKNADDYAAIKKEKAVVVRPQYVTRYLPSKQYAPAVIFGLIATGYNLVGRPELASPTLYNLSLYSPELCLGFAALGYCLKYKKWGYVPAITSYLFGPIITISPLSAKQNGWRMPNLVKRIYRSSEYFVPALLLSGHAYEVYQEEHTEKSISPEQEFVSVE